MKQIITLLKKDILITYGFIFNIKAIWKSKKHRRSLIFNLIAILALISYFVFIFKNFGFIKNEDIYNTIYNTGMLITIFMLISGMSMIVSKLHMNDDLRIMLRLPIKTENILIVNILNLIVGFMFINIMMFYPLLIINFINGRHEISFIIFGLLASIGLLLFNICVIMIVSILVLLIMNKLPGSKKILQIIGMILFIILVIGISVMFQFMRDGSAVQFLGDDYSKKVAYIIPQLKLFTDSIVSSNIGTKLLSLFILFAISAILILFITKVLGKVFINSLINQKVEKRKIKIGKNKKKSTLAHLIGIEATSIFRNMSYVFNLMIMVFIMPMMLIVMVIIARVNLHPSQWQEMVTEVHALFDVIGISGTFGIGCTIGLVLCYYTSGLQPITATSISRHKETLWLMQSLPINEEKQLRAKFLFGLLINMINIPILLVITACTIGFNFGLYIGLILGGMAGYLFALTSGLLIDVINPKLEWTEPINAVKKNPNLFISMIICYAVIFLYGYTIYKLVILKEINNPYFNPNEMFDIVSNIGVFTYVALAIFTILSIIMYVVSVRIYKNKLKTY